MKTTKKSVITSALVVILIMLSSTFLISTNYNFAFASTTTSTTSPSDLLKYEWTTAAASSARTNFAEGPSPSTPNIQWKATISTNLLQGPWAFNGLVIVQTFGFLYFGYPAGGNTIALDKNTGNIVWNISASGNVVKLDNNYMLIGANCYKIADGSLVWTGPTGFSQQESTRNGVNYISDLKKLVSGPLAWDLSDPSKIPTIYWNRTTLADYAQYGVESTQVYGDGVIVYSTSLDFLRGVNATNGKTIWTAATSTGFTYGMSYVDGKIIHGGYDGNMRAWNITNGELIWTYNPGSYYNQWSWATAVAYGMVYEHNQDTYIYAVNATTGELVWKAKGSGIAYSNYLTIAGGKVFCQMGEAQYRDFATGKYGQSEYVAFDAFTGKRIWSASFENGAPGNYQCNAYGNLYVIPTPPSVGQNGTYVYSSVQGGGTTLGEVWCISDMPKDWSMFQSDPTLSGDGYGPTNLSLKWKFTTGAEISASPTFANGVGYIGSKDGKIYAFNATTGDEIWNFTAGLMVYSTVAVVNGKLYTGAENGYVLCLDANSGKVIWNTTVSGVPPMTNVGFSTTAPVSNPIVINGRVYLGANNGNMYCLDANSGTIIWQVSTGGKIYATPAVVDNALYITSSTFPVGTLLKLDPNTGQTLLNVSIPYSDRSLGFGMTMDASPTVANGMVFVRPSLYYNYAINATNGQIIWIYNATINPGTPSQSGGTQQLGAPLYKYGLIYINDYYGITALNARNGSVVWQSYTSRENLAQGITYSYGRLYVVNEAGIMHVLDAQTGESLSFYSLNTQMHSTPTPYNGSLYVGTNDWNLYCFSEAPPVTVVSTDITFELRPSSIVRGESVTVAGSINGVHSAVPMNVYFSKGDSSNPVTINATTDGNGGFTVKFAPDIVGEWSVAASWAGDATHTAGSSQIQTLTVTEPVTPEPTQTPQSLADLYFLPMSIAIIVAIIVVGVITVLALRKRP